MFGFSLIRVKSCMWDRLDKASVGISGRVYFVQSWTSSVVKFGMIFCWITDFIRKNLKFLSNAPIDKLLCYRQFEEEMVWSNLLDDQSGYKRLHLCQIEYVFSQLMEKKWEETTCYRGCVILRAVASWKISFCLFVLFHLFQGQNVKYIEYMLHCCFIEKGLSMHLNKKRLYFAFMKFIGKLFLKAERKKIGKAIMYECWSYRCHPWKLIISVGQHLDFEN